MNADPIPCSAYVLENYPRPCIPRKRHRCCICDERIEVGEPCCRWSSVLPQEGWRTGYAHPECMDITQDWLSFDWEYPPEMDRPSPRMFWPAQSKNYAVIRLGAILDPALEVPPPSSDA